MGSDATFYSINRSGDIFGDVMDFLNRDSNLKDNECYFGREYLLNTGFVEDYLERNGLEWDMFMKSNYWIDSLGERPLKGLHKSDVLGMLYELKDFMDANRLYSTEVKEIYEDEVKNPDYFITPCYSAVCDCITFIESLDEDDKIIIISS
jgi:hypothetical protein